MVKINIVEKISIIKFLLGQNKSHADIERETGIPKQTVSLLVPIRKNIRKGQNCHKFIKK